MTNITDCDCNDEIDAKYISSQVLGYIGAAIVISFNIPQVVKMVKNKSSKELAEKLIFIIRNKSLLKEKSILARDIISRQNSQAIMFKKYNLNYEIFLKKM